MSGRDDRIRELYEAALKRPIGERAAFVAEHAHGDVDVQRRVEALLAGQQDTRLSGYEGADGGVLATGTEIGHYRIDGPLGAGGMGVVYRATDTKLHRPAAIKVLPETLADPEARRRFQREAQLVSSLNHPHIVTVYDAGEYLERQYLITEFVDGGTLRQWAARPRGWRPIVELLIGVADGVAAAHAAGILHRDIKPENILLAKNGYAKLADFGIAKLLEADPLADDPLTGVRAGGHSTLIGTAAYMSPEQAQGLPLDGRSDVYSFGLVLYELLSQERLVERDLTRGRGNEPERLAPLGDDVPAELRALVAKALEHEPADRYQTMRDLVVDLRRLARRSGIETYSAPSTASPPHAPTAAAPTATKRRPTRQIAYLFGGLALFAIALWLGREYGAQLGAPVGNAVAVLPFVNEGGDPDDLHLSEGIGDALRDQLAPIPGLRVAARASSIAFRDQVLDVKTIAERLDVALLVSGTVRREAEGTVSVRVEIIDGETAANDGFSQRYQGNLVEIERQIATEVTAHLLPRAPLAVAATPTANPVAATALMLGRQFEREVLAELVVDEAKLDKTIELYRQAVAADPQSELAHSRLAGALAYRGDVNEAAAELYKAMAFGKLSETYHTLALYALRVGSTIPAIATEIQPAFNKAIELNPNNADALGAYALWLMTHAQSHRAEPYFQRALVLDPLSLPHYLDYAEYLSVRGRREDLLALAETIETRFPNANGYRAIARVHQLAGDLDVGIAWALRALERQPGDEDTQLQIAELYALIGDFLGAQQYEPEPVGLSQLLFQRRYPELIDLAEELRFDDPANLDITYMLAFAYNERGNFAGSIRLLEDAGLPHVALIESSVVGQMEALQTWADASLASGFGAKIKEPLEARIALYPDAHRLRGHWWSDTYRACALADLGRTGEALETLEVVKASVSLPWLHLLKDSWCFKRFAAEPRYRAVIDNVEARQAKLRQRLPATLREHGVADVRARGPR